MLSKKEKANQAVKALEELMQAVDNPLCDYIKEWIEILEFYDR